MIRFTLQLAHRPPPWVPHLHKCTTCGQEFPCDLPDECNGNVRYRPHIGDCYQPISFSGIDYAYSSSRTAFVTYERRGALGRVLSLAWDDPHLSAIAQARTRASWQQPQTSPVDDLRSMMASIATRGFHASHTIVADDPVPDPPMTPEMRQKAMAWFEDLRLGNDDRVPERPLPLAVNHFTPKRAKPKRRRKRRRR